MSMSIPDYTALTRETSRNLAPLRAKLPDVMQGFGALSKAALAPGALDAKTKELIAMAIGVAVYMGGGPSLMYAANAIAAYKEFIEAA